MVLDPGAWTDYFQKARCLLPFAMLCMWFMCAAAWSSSSTFKAVQSAPIRPLFGLAALLIAVRGPWAALLTLAASSTVMLTISAVKVLANPSLYSRYSEEFPGIMQSYSSTCLIAGALINGSVAAMIATRQRRYAVVGAVPLSVAAIVLRATGSRMGAIAALIGTMVSVVSLVMSKCARRWRLVIAAAMLTAVVGALFLNSAASNRLISRIYGAPDSSVNYKPIDGTAAFLCRVAGDRGPIWFVALSLAGQRPMFGWGSKSWKDIYPAEAKRLSPALGLMNPQVISTHAGTYHAHNTFLQVFVEQGVIGLILLCWVLVECWHRSKQVQDPILRAVLLGVLMVWLTQGMSEPLLNFPVSTVFLGLIIVTTAIPTSTPQQQRL
jgi:O-antigen ligase